MLQTLFQEQRRYLNHFFDSIDQLSVEKIFDIVRACQGTILVTGVGKSGHIAQKIAATFVSTGTRSLFLSPNHALHGDIGIISSKDVLLAFSKSGESEELLELIPFIRKKGAFTVGVVSSPSSRLSRMADASLHLPVCRELCPYDLAPTTSTAAQLLFGDCLAIALMRANQFTQADFAANHPAGFLGRKITLKVSDLMLTGDAIPQCRQDAKLIDVLHELTAKRCGCLLISRDGMLDGIFTDGDLRRAIQTKGEAALQTGMEQLMTPTPAATTANRLAVEALRQMEADANRLITVLPVTEEGRIIGLLRMHDILQAGLH